MGGQEGIVSCTVLRSEGILLLMGSDRIGLYELKIGTGTGESFPHGLKKACFQRDSKFNSVTIFSSHNVILSDPVDPVKSRSSLYEGFLFGGDNIGGYFTSHNKEAFVQALVRDLEVRC